MRALVSITTTMKGEMMNGKLFQMILGMAVVGVAFSGGEAFAAAPTLISSDAGRYCYDFGNYIPSTDSPVVGGFYVGTLGTDGAVGEAYFNGDAIFGFGKACTETPLSEGANGGVARWSNVGQLLYYTGASYDVGGRWYGYSNDTGNLRPLRCPFNHAMIKTDGYLRSDGVQRPSQPLHPYSVSGYAHGYSATWALATGRYVNSATYPGYLEFKDQAITSYLCVKTDTTQ